MGLVAVTRAISVAVDAIRRNAIRNEDDIRRSGRILIGDIHGLLQCTSPPCTSISRQVFHCGIERRRLSALIGTTIIDVTREREQRHLHRAISIANELSGQVVQSVLGNIKPASVFLRINIASV